MTYQELQSTDVRQTRRPHRCEWCGEMIEAGSRAHHRVYRFDGFCSEYMHPECAEAMRELPSEYWEDGWSAGQFRRGSIEERHP